MIFGDSFTGGYFAPLLLQHAGRVIWLDHRFCGFDWKAIDRFHPDEVWWMPNERFLICAPGARPLDFAEEKRRARAESNGKALEPSSWEQLGPVPRGAGMARDTI